MQNDKSMVVPFFKTVAVENPHASKAEGRPIFKDVEMCEIRIAGERNYSPTFPAHEIWRHVDGYPVTYAERFPEAYARFAAGREQVAEGTPLSELPFLTESKRAALRSLKVYTAEALATLDGKKLTNLGPDAREMKTAAEAYLEKAGGSAQTVALAAEVEQLRAELAAVRNETPAASDDEKEALKAAIAEMTGQRPKGNPSVETLREMVADLKAGQAA